MSNAIYSLPITPILQNPDEWLVSMRQKSDPLFVFKLPRNPPGWRVGDPDTPLFRRRLRTKDPFELRGRFFEVKTPNDALAFFQEFGPMEIDEHLEKTAGAVPFSWVIERREFYRDALLNRPIKIETEIDFDDDDSWDNACLWRDLPLDLVFQQPMKALVYCKDVEAALRATVFLDRLKGLRWRACAREDCNKPFELPPRRAKMFCSPECAHLQSVRNYNKRKRSPKAEKAIKSVKKKVRG